MFKFSFYETNRWAVQMFQQSWKLKLYLSIRSHWFWWSTEMRKLFVTVCLCALAIKLAIQRVLFFHSQGPEVWYNPTGSVGKKLNSKQYWYRSRGCPWRHSCSKTKWFTYTYCASNNRRLHIYEIECCWYDSNITKKILALRSKIQKAWHLIQYNLSRAETGLPSQNIFRCEPNQVGKWLN